MGKKKRVKKELECQLQLGSIFEGVFDSQLIASILKETEGDEELALLRLTDLKNAMYEGGMSCTTAGGGDDMGGDSSSQNNSVFESHIDQIHSIFQTYDRDVIAMMLLECENNMEKVIEIISGECDKAPLPLTSSPTTTTTSTKDQAGICTINDNTHINCQESTDNPFQIIKYMLTDFMSTDKIEKYLQDKQCTEHSSLEYLQSVMNEILVFVSMNTTCDDIADTYSDESLQTSLCDRVSQTLNSIQPSSALPSSDFDMNLCLFESTLQFDREEQFDMPPLSFSDDRNELIVAKNIVWSFFENTAIAETKISHVSDAMIETALELSKDSNFIGAYDPDSAISWICEEINSKKQNKISPKSRVVPNTGKQTTGKQTPMTYASKLLCSEEEKRPVACSFGGDSEKTPDSNPLSSAPAQSQSQTRSRSLHTEEYYNIDIDIEPPEHHHLPGGHASAGAMATYWRNVHQENKQHMLNSFAAASSTRSRDTVVTAQRFKHCMYHAAAESSKFAILSRNPHVKVSNSSGCFVEFLGFVKNTPKKLISVDMHGVDVRSAVQFVKSLVETCYCAGNHVSISLIVGVGNHSIRNIARLKPALVSFLKSNSVVKLLGGVEGKIDFSIGK